MQGPRRLRTCLGMVGTRVGADLVMRVRHLLCELRTAMQRQELSNRFRSLSLGIPVMHMHRTQRAPLRKGVDVTGL